MRTLTATTIRQVAPWCAALALAVIAFDCTAGEPAATTSHGPGPASAAGYAACLRPGPAPASCPAFLVDAAQDAARDCGQVGGRLELTGQSGLTPIDIDGDGRDEYLYDMPVGFNCEGAASIFSCGSLGCPVALYQKQGSHWRSIGSIFAMDAPGLEVLRPQHGKGFATLRGGCIGERPCDRLDSYTWNGHEYQMTHIDVRGHQVTPIPGALYTIRQTVAVLAEPSARSTVLYTSEPGAIFTIIGKADGTDYLYVAPCRACVYGFVTPAAVGR